VVDDVGGHRGRGESEDEAFTSHVHPSIALGGTRFTSADRLTRVPFGGSHHGHAAVAKADGTVAAAKPESAEAIAPGTVMALLAMGLGVIVIANDFTALNVALPAIEQDFNVDVGTVQWVINAYCLVFGMAIVTGGRLADLFGRRGAFFVGTAIFATFSLLGGVAQDTPWLIGARVGMGVGGALMWPAILGMTYAALPESKAGLAGGIILGAAGLGNAMGPLVGGVLTDELSWRWIFYVNIPIAAFAVIVTWFKVHQPRPVVEDQRVDYPGIATLSTGLLLLLLAFDQAADWGFGDWRVVAMLAAAAVLVALFGTIEPRMRGAALIPGDVIRNGEFRSACLTVLLMSAVFFATVLYAPQFMEKILGYSALKAGVGMVPMLGTFTVVSFFAGPLYQRLGAKVTITIGALGLAVGPFLLSLVDSDSGYGALVGGLAITGFGAGFFYPSVTTAGVTALDPSKASLAGGLIYMFQIAGGAIGLGITTTIFTLSSENDLGDLADSAGTHLTDQQVSVMHGALAGTSSGEAALNQLPAAVHDRILGFVQQSFTHGIQAGFRFVTIAAVLGFLISLFFVGGRLLPQRTPAAEKAEA
jgi:EmrB/QacA subfamily drug resistance transporter